MSAAARIISGAAAALAGLGLCGWGLRTAARARRPASLGAALIAAVGLALALAGLTALLVPGF